MALVGTVSGSNGTTVSAVTGSLIVAANPGTITPVRPTDVVLYVSGAATSVGSDVPSILLKGDTFISGALGTDSYFQMKPVNTLRIPTNTTASYIYTSGSTNDIYFTQYSGPFTNTTRLRWLEGMLTTGLLHGGVLSTATGSTTFSITAGSGIILSYNASVTTDPYPTVNYVQWPTYVSQSLTYVTSSLITYIGINPAGGIIQQTSPFTISTDSDYITIGRVLHQSGSVTNGVSTQPIVSYGTNHWHDDFTRAFGPLKVSGHILAASGSTLGITKTAGDSYVIGKNYTTDPNNPNNITSATDTAVTVSKIYRAYVSGSTLRLDTGVNNAGYTDINPAQYNNNGTLASVGAANASIQRVYWYPNTVSRAFTVYYGSATYAANPFGASSALDVAQQNIASEIFVEGENTAGAAILVGYILARGNATDLSNTAQARFIQAGVSRGAGAGGGGGVAVGATSAAGLDTYVQFNDGGSTFGGDAGLTYDKTTDTLTIAGDLVVNGGDITTSAGTFSIANATATTVNLGAAASTVNIGAAGSAATFAGNVTGSNALLSGDIAVNGGDITTTSATFNLVTGSASTVNFAGTATTVNIGAQSGRTTITNDLAVGTGNIIGAPGSGGNVMTLLSSGNIVARLDVNNDAAGHRFIVQDYTGASQFFVGENGNAELTGSLTVTGSIKALSGFSGSLTKLADGTDYLIAGSNITLTTGSSGAVTVANTSIPTLGAVYGGGAHGAFDLDGTNTYANQFTKAGSIYTQTADVRATTFRVRSGSIVQPSQFWIYAESAFRNDGTIRNNGNSGSIDVAGLAVSAAGTLQCQGQAGPAGRTSSAFGFSNSVTQVIGGAGGSGGSGGGANGGGSSTATPPGATSQAVGTSFFMATHRRLDVITVNTVNAGIGGGAGGATLNTGTARSGGAGGGGSAIRINARSFQNNGTITCDGGGGGNATTTGDAVAGGGGGGGGGFIGIMCDTLVSLGTVTCTGGLGGLGSGGGTAGGMGLSGSISVTTPTGTTNL